MAPVTKTKSGTMSSVKRKGKEIEKKEKPSKKGTFGKAANINGESYSDIANRILTKTGDRKKAIEKLNEVGCKSSAAIVAVTAKKLGIASSRPTKKTVSSKKKSEPDLIQRKGKNKPSSGPTKKKKEVVDEDEEFDEDLEDSEEESEDEEESDDDDSEEDEEESDDDDSEEEEDF